MVKDLLIIPIICFVGLDILKFIYYEKATKFCEIFTLLLPYVVPVKIKVKISQNFVAFSEHMNFNSYSFKIDTLGRWVDHLIDQASDGPSIILVD